MTQFVDEAREVIGKLLDDLGERFDCHLVLRQSTIDVFIARFYTNAKLSLRGVESRK